MNMGLINTATIYVFDEEWWAFKKLARCSYRFEADQLGYEVARALETGEMPPIPEKRPEAKAHQIRTEARVAENLEKLADQYGVALSRVAEALVLAAVSVDCRA